METSEEEDEEPCYPLEITRLPVGKRGGVKSGGDGKVGFVEKNLL